MQANAPYSSPKIELVELQSADFFLAVSPEGLLFMEDFFSEETEL